MKHLAPKIGLSLGVIALTVAAAASPATASTTTAAKAHTASWHPVLTLRDASTPADNEAFSAVVAIGHRSGWAFLSSDKATYAYQRTGPATWRKVPFPGQGGDVAVAAGEQYGPVFASYDVIGQNSKVYEWTGTKWQLFKVIPGQVTGMSELNADDVWFFGTKGVTRWNGHAWIQLTSSARGGYALRDNDVWAYDGQTIRPYNGKTWTSADARKLLPPAGPDTMKNVEPYVTAVLALSATDVYATGEGTGYPHGGPMALLHYNGHAWSRVLLAGNSTSPVQQDLVPDGKGGLWIPAGDGAQNPALFHYTAAGKLTRSLGPGKTTYVFPGSSVMARIPGTAEMLAAGVGFDNSDKTSPVILEYS